MSVQRILLVDASVYVFRAWHSMPDDLHDAEGQPANAVQGFVRFLLDLLQRERPGHIAICFDEALETSFRNQLYPAYKANREPAPEALKRQFSSCQACCRLLGLATLADPQFEADDLIGSVLARLRPQGFQACIVSADKDLSQLLRAGDEQWDFARDQRWGHPQVMDRYGAPAEAIADFLGLAGDSVDNIPGVPGIGSKTASALLAHFGSLDALLARLDEVPYLRLRGAAAHAARLREHRQQALLSRQLATIATDAAVAADAEHYRRRALDRPGLDRFIEQFKFGPITRRRLLES